VVRIWHSHQVRQGRIEPNRQTLATIDRWDASTCMRIPE
jgi:hypothetical protein